MKLRLAGLGLLALALSGPAAAQSLSAEEIKARAVQEAVDLGGYRELLADPDPARAAAMMEAMLESGDSSLRAMALEHGLTHANPALRRKALEGFFASRPYLELFFSQKPRWTGDDADYLVGPISRSGGSITAKGEGYLLLRVGPFRADQACALDAEEQDCLVRVTDSGVSLEFQDAWLALKLNAKGELAGSVALDAMSDPSPLRIPIR